MANLLRRQAQDQRKELAGLASGRIPARRPIQEFPVEGGPGLLGQRDISSGIFIVA